MQVRDLTFVAFEGAGRDVQISDLPSCGGALAGTVLEANALEILSLSRKLLTRVSEFLYNKVYDLPPLHHTWGLLRFAALCPTEQ